MRHVVYGLIALSLLTGCRDVRDEALADSIVCIKNDGNITDTKHLMLYEDDSLKQLVATTAIVFDERIPQEEAVAFVEHLYSTIYANEVGVELVDSRDDHQIVMTLTFNFDSIAESSLERLGLSKRAHYLLEVYQTAGYSCQEASLIEA